jgi:hypothetical protein
VNGPVLLAGGAVAGLAQLGISTTDAVVSIVVFVIVGSLTIAGPVIYYLVGGEEAKAKLEELKRPGSAPQCGCDDGDVPDLRRRSDRQAIASAHELKYLSATDG